MNRLPTRLLAFLFALFVTHVSAHEMRPGLLELKEGEDDHWEMTWKVPARGPNMRLALDVRLPDDVEWVTLPSRSYTGTAFIDRGTFTREGGLNEQEIYIEGLLSTFTDAIVQVQRLDGTAQSERLEPSQPSFVVQSRPDPDEITRFYFGAGMSWLVNGWDHLLFLVGLLVLARSTGGFLRGVLAFLLVSGTAAVVFVAADLPISPTWIEILLAIGLGAVAWAAVGQLAGTADRTTSPALYGGVIGIVHGFSYGDGYSAVSASSGPFTALAAYLAGILVALALFAGILLFVAWIAKHIAALVKPKGGSSSPTATLCPFRFSYVTAYVVGIAGIFAILLRW